MRRRVWATLGPVAFGVARYVRATEGTTVRFVSADVRCGHTEPDALVRLANEKAATVAAPLRANG